MKRILSITFSIFFIMLLCLPTFADSDMPYWYYKGDLSSFTDFHGENLPRVVDDADIFSDDEEAALNSRMNEVIEKLGIGYVLFTDDDNHGLSPEEYSSDFLHFGGYGVGDGYGAVVFYLCFDPSDRCWRTTSINSYEQIFTQTVTYEIDETVDADIRAGRYYEAFFKHIDFVENLFSRTTENLADWYPDDIENTAIIDRDTRDYSASPVLSSPRIVDNANLFSDKSVDEISSKLSELSEKYNVDLAVFTDENYNTLYRGDYVDDFYYYNGYGEDGIVFYIIGDEITGTIYYGTMSFGKCYDEYYDIKHTFLDAAEAGVDDDNYDKALKDYTKRLEFVLKHGRPPMETKNKLICLAVGIIAGLIVGGIHLAICIKGMKVVAPVDAREYLVKDSFVLRDKKVFYLYSTVTKTAKPKSSSSSGGGGSSYSSGSSSGGSYSSGGRSF